WRFSSPERKTARRRSGCRLRADRYRLSARVGAGSWSRPRRIIAKVEWHGDAKPRRQRPASGCTVARYRCMTKLYLIRLFWQLGVGYRQEGHDRGRSEPRAMPV